MKLADEVKALPEKELDEFLSWLADYELVHPRRWDQEIEHNSQFDEMAGRRGFLWRRELCRLMRGFWPMPAHGGVELADRSCAN